jgi:nicotinate phosphoribosyltransferase
MVGDLVSPVGEQHDGVPLLIPIMRGGRRISASPPLSEIRRCATAGLEQLPPPLAALETLPYPVAIADSLRRLAEDCNRRIVAAQAAP